jgi:hypothetical protein
VQPVATWSEVPDREPAGALADGVDLVMADGRIDGGDIICGLRGRDDVFHTGVSSYDNSDRLDGSSSWICADDLTRFDREMAHVTGVAYGGVRL